MIAAASPRCQHHPERQATPCSRCGDFVCDDCCGVRDDARLCGHCLEVAAPIADPGLRLGAYVVNQLSYSVPAVVLVALGSALPTEHGLLVGFGLAVLWSVCLTLVNLRLLWRDGQSVGKRWLGVRILRDDGTRATLTRLLGMRWFVPGALGMVPAVGWIFSLANVLFVFSTSRRCLHDRIADTIVVEVPPQRP